jgi:plastocyanin
MSMTDFGMQMFARFLPTYLEIHQNDTVTWIIGGHDPHWVFFNAAQTFPPLFANWDEHSSDTLDPSIAYVNDPYSLGIIWFANGAPLTTIPTQIWPNNDGLINSGMMFGAGGPPVFPSNISVKFTTIGSWNYSCPIHAAIAMFGTINVKEPGSSLCTNPEVLRTCATTTAVRGDPQFSGFLGQSFQVHGIDGAVYNLISDDDIQINSIFSFIDGDSIACPQQPWKYAGLRQKIQCWSHAGSYLGAVGVMDNRGNKLTINAGTSTNGFDSVLFNEISVSVGTVSAGLLTVTLHSSHHLSVVADEFTLHIDNSDGFVNLASVTIDRNRWSQLSAHGLLGQTWHRVSTDKRGPIEHIEGNVDDYLINENTLFGHSFVYNRFAA